MNSGLASKEERAIWPPGKSALRPFPLLSSSSSSSFDLLGKPTSVSGCSLQIGTCLWSRADYIVTDKNEPGGTRELWEGKREFKVPSIYFSKRCLRSLPPNPPGNEPITLTVAGETRAPKSMEKKWRVCVVVVVGQVRKVAHLSVFQPLSLDSPSVCSRLSFFSLFFHQPSSQHQPTSRQFKPLS